MNSEWRLQADQAVYDHRFSLEHLLVWYDEPQVITARDQKNMRYIGVVVDDSEDGELVRWIYAPLTDLEFRALVCGGLSVRDALEATTVIVADRRVDGGLFEGMWLSQSADIPAGLLPSPDSFLPETTRTRFADTISTEPEIRIAGTVIHNNLISFDDLGAIVDRIQQLWHALGGAIWYKKQAPTQKSAGEGFIPSTLLAAGVGPGSFAIKVKAEQEAVFNSISASYRALVDISQSEDDLKNALDNYGRDVTNSFADYMVLVENRKMEVYTQSAKTTAFIGPRKAARVVGYPYIGQRKAAKKRVGPVDVATTTFTLNGHFEGYSYISKKFDFINGIDGQRYSGDIEDSVLTRMPIERGLILSSAAIYTAEIRSVRAGDRNTYTLLAFWTPQVGVG